MLLLKIKFCINKLKKSMKKGFASVHNELSTYTSPRTKRRFCMNKQYTAITITVVVAVLVTVTVSFAGQIQPTVNVTGTLNGVCKAGAAGSLAFTIDPSLAGPVSATITDATVFCSNGTPFTITAVSNSYGGSASSCASSGGGITGTLKDASNNTMNYTFTCGVNGTTGNTGTGQGFGSGKAIALGLAGSISAASYQNAPAGTTYADTITLTITY